MKKTWLVPIALMLAAALVLAVPETPAQDPNGSPEPGATPPEALSPQPDEPAATKPEESASTDPLETFVPSEKLPADSAISYPVDI